MAMLNSLVIKNFRMLEDFKVEKLGRVNLIVGKNNSGKSTVLEALRIYAESANPSLLSNIAISHDEPYKLEKTKFGELNSPMPFEGFFIGRKLPDDYTQIIIGDLKKDSSLLHIGYQISINANETRTDNSNNNALITNSKNDYIELAKESNIDFKTKQNLLICSKNNTGFFIHLDECPIKITLFSNYKELSVISCSFIPTKFIEIEELESEWSDINLTDDEDKVVEALQIIDKKVQRLAFDGNKNKRWIKVKLSDLPKPVPLKSLGDGMLRILQIAIKLVSAQGGFLLIDEFENGLHYSVQEKVWTLLFEMAEKLDVQIFATTHSWDCIRSFNAVAMEKENIDAILFRMGKSALNSNKDQVIATVYDKERLHTFTERDMEVR